jgi:hypothetical protein
MADFLEDKKREIESRLKELRPLVDEFHRLEAAVAALSGVGASASRGTGTRSKEALALVRKQPGITIPELAEAMKIKQNYLYRVLPGLAQDGLVAKKGRGWHPKDAA